MERISLPDGFYPVPALQEVFVDRTGKALLNQRGKLKTLKMYKGSSRKPYYMILGAVTPVSLLLVLAFGPGAASQAGYDEPDARLIECALNNTGQNAHAKVEGSVAMRFCHDCGKPTSDYRCPLCWSKLRGFIVRDCGEWNEFA